MDQPGARRLGDTLTISPHRELRQREAFPEELGHHGGEGAPSEQGAKEQAGAGSGGTGLRGRGAHPAPDFPRQYPPPSPGPTGGRRRWSLWGRGPEGRVLAGGAELSADASILGPDPTSESGVTGRRLEAAAGGDGGDGTRSLRSSPAIPGQPRGGRGPVLSLRPCRTLSPGRSTRQVLRGERGLKTSSEPGGGP